MRSWVLASLSFRFLLLIIDFITMYSCINSHPLRPTATCFQKSSTLKAAAEWGPKRCTYGKNISCLEVSFATMPSSGMFTYGYLIKPAEFSLVSILVPKMSNPCYLESSWCKRRDPCLLLPWAALGAQLYRLFNQSSQFIFLSVLLLLTKNDICSEQNTAFGNGFGQLKVLAFPDAAFPVQLPEVLRPLEAACSVR